MSPPLNIQEMEGSPREKLPPEVFDYYSGGAWDLQTLHENQVLSSLSTCRLEDVAAAASGPLWFQEALEMPRKEFDLAMALSGCSTLDDITPDLFGRA